MQFLNSEKVSVKKNVIQEEGCNKEEKEKENEKSLTEDLVE